MCWIGGGDATLSHYNAIANAKNKIIESTSKTFCNAHHTPKMFTEKANKHRSYRVKCGIQIPTISKRATALHRYDKRTAYSNTQHTIFTVSEPSKNFMWNEWVWSDQLKQSTVHTQRWCSNTHVSLVQKRICTFQKEKTIQFVLCIYARRFINVCLSCEIFTIRASFLAANNRYFHI